MKICSHCKQTKDEEDFCRNKRMKDGLNSRCRECDRVSQHLRRYGEVRPKPPTPADGHKFCRKCGKELPVSCFFKHAKTADGLRGECIDCHYQRSKEWIAKNGSRHRELGRIRDAGRRLEQRNNYLRRTYGITHDQYLTLLSDQGNKCAICETILEIDDNTKCHIDHDHETNTVRGVLCGRCNMALGLVRESEHIVWCMSRYIATHKKMTSIVHAVS